MVSQPVEVQQSDEACFCLLALHACLLYLLTLPLLPHTLPALNHCHVAGLTGPSAAWTVGKV